MDDLFVFPALHILDPVTTTKAQKLSFYYSVFCFFLMTILYVKECTTTIVMRFIELCSIGY